MGQTKSITIPRISQDYFPTVTGVTNQVRAIAKGLEERGILSPVITTTPPLPGEPPEDGVTVHRFSTQVSIPNFRFSYSLLHFVQKMDASIFHVHQWRNPNTDGAFIMACQRHIPIVVQAHGNATYRLANQPPIMMLLRHLYDAVIKRILIRHAATVIAHSKFEQDALIAYGFSPNRVVTISVGIHQAFFNAAPQRQFQDNQITLLTVGRLAPLRNIEQSIKAIALLRQKKINVNLRIVGPEVKLGLGEASGYIQRLEKLVVQLGLQKNVVFTGPRFGGELIEEYCSADMFLYSSLHENFGQSIAEAAATGLPIISTPAGIAPELLAKNEAGNLVPFQDAEAMAEAVFRLCVHPELRYQMGQNAAQRGKAMFDWNKIIPQYIDLYRDILDHQVKRSF